MTVMALGTHSTKGATLIEFGLMLGVVGMICAGVAASVSDMTRNIFQDLAMEVSSPEAEAPEARAYTPVPGSVVWTRAGSLPEAVSPPEGQDALTPVNGDAGSQGGEASTPPAADPIARTGFHIRVPDGHLGTYSLSEMKDRIILSLDVADDTVGGFAMQGHPRQFRGKALRLAADRNNHRISIVCDYAPNCLGTFSFTAEIFSWNPSKATSADYTITLVP